MTYKLIIKNINYVAVVLLLLYILFVRSIVKHISVLFKSKVFNLTVLLLICYAIKHKNIVLGMLLTVSYILSYVSVFGQDNVENFNEVITFLESLHE